MKIKLPVIALLVLSASLSFAQTKELPAVGVYCWDANSEPDLAGYHLFIAAPEGPRQLVDLGIPKDIPARCAELGKIGVVRDQSADQDGGYSFRITAYDTAGNESEKSTEFTYPLNAQPPETPGGCVAF